MIANNPCLQIARIFRVHSKNPFDDAKIRAFTAQNNQ